MESLFAVFYLPIVLVSNFSSSIQLREEQTWVSLVFQFLLVLIFCRYMLHDVFLVLRRLADDLQGRNIMFRTNPKMHAGRDKDSDRFYRHNNSLVRER